MTGLSENVSAAAALFVFQVPVSETTTLHDLVTP
jgi:hypothetical protein